MKGGVNMFTGSWLYPLLIVSVMIVVCAAMEMLSLAITVPGLKPRRQKTA